MTSVAAKYPVAERIVALDVLRGIALLGMFLVHFHMFSSGPGSWPGVSSVYDWIVVNLFEERFWTMFGILFGAGFAVQMRRAEARGTRLSVAYLRRMAVLAVFGVVAHGIFGFNVLLGYAIWGAALLLFRGWSIRALTIALVVSAMSGSIYSIGCAGIRAATLGEQAGRADAESVLARNQAFHRDNRAAQEAPEFVRVVQARLQHMGWFYRQPFSFLPVNTLTLFLLGTIALRLGYFDDPARHRRAIWALMAFGLASWAIVQWAPDFGGLYTAPPLRSLLLDSAVAGFGLIRGTWLSLVYIGAVLLLVARDRAWLNRLSLFAWTGRMALTNYMIQIVILDLMFSNYALGLQLTTLQSIVAALVLFGLNAVASRRWLSGFRFGPLEWLWRSATYGGWQPWRRHAAVMVIVFAFAGCSGEPRNADCRLPLDDKPQNAADPIRIDQPALDREALLAEDLAIRFADRTAGPRSTWPRGRDGYRAVRDECMATLFAVVSRRHGVSVAQVREAAGHRQWSFDAISLGLLVVLFSFTAMRVIRWIAGGTLGASTRVAFVALAAASIALAVIGFGAGSVWSGLAEAIRLGNGHASYRVERIPWRQHPFVMFNAGIVLFWLAAAWHYYSTQTRTRPSRRSTKSSTMPGP